MLKARKAALAVVLLMLPACGATPQLGAAVATPGDGRTGIGRPVVFAAGDAGFCALRAPGRLVCWGRTFGDSMRPLDALEDYVEVGVGENHVCARRRDGEVRCAGDNDAGQLGRPLRDVAQSSAPVPVPGLPPSTRLGVDNNATCVLSNAGEVRCFGRELPWPEPGGPRQVDAPMLLPRIAGARQLSFADHLACIVEENGGVSCFGGYGPEKTRARIGGFQEMADVRHSGLVVCGREVSGLLRCAPQPHPTSGFGSGPKWPIPLESLIYPREDRASDLVVELATICVRPEGGRWRCLGEAQGAPIDARGLADLARSEALLLVDSEIGCGLDSDGALRTQERSKGFCGEDGLRMDGRGRDLQAEARAGFSAEISPRLRLGGLKQVEAGVATSHFAGGLAVPTVFGRPGGVLAGAELDLATRGFDTVEPAAGLAVDLPLGGARLGADLLGGVAFGPEETAPLLAGGLRLGAAMVLTDPRCEHDCGLRYTASAGLGLSVRRTLGDVPRTEYVVVVDFDAAALIAPFALMAADWNFR